MVLPSRDPNPSFFRSRFGLEADSKGDSLSQELGKERGRITLDLGK